MGSWSPPRYGRFADRRSDRSRSGAGQLRHRLESSPAGMKVAADGKLEWKVPLDLADEQASVILTVADASGQEVYHSFNITIDAGNATGVGTGAVGMGILSLATV